MLNENRNKKSVISQADKWIKAGYNLIQFCQHLYEHYQISKEKRKKYPVNVTIL